MKFSTKNLHPVLTMIEHKNLTILVEERLDVPMPATTKKKFGSVDLWNINKQRKSFKIRRYL